jgi:hypothetical protein
MMLSCTLLQFSLSDSRQRSQLNLESTEHPPFNEGQDDNPETRLTHHNPGGGGTAP